MKRMRILLFSISLLMFLGASAQNKKKTPLDTVPKIERYGIRVGLDLAKPIRSFIEDDYKGFEIVGDLRVTRNFYAAAELGNEEKIWNEPYVSSKTSGSYAKLGIDYNAYENWTGMDNAISVGLRYGFSTFKQELLSHSIYTTSPVFPSDLIYDGKSFSGLTAHWAELIVGIKTEVLKNVYLSLSAQLKLKLSDDKPENFDNLYIPGFHRTYDYSEFGVGYSYSISYLIPIFKKDRTAILNKENE